MGVKGMGKIIKEQEAYDALRLYFGKYIQEVLHLAPSTARHYFNALNTVSKYLIEKGLLKQSIYEVLDLDRLINLRDILYQDEDFMAQDKRGNNMYRSGLKHYIDFAEGNFINAENGKVIDVRNMDLPAAPEAIIDHSEEPGGASTGFIKRWRRSSIIRNQVLEFAGFTCELHPEHQTFIAESTRHPYMEGHHLIPMSEQGEFEHSLDVYANIICLCPICHRRIHLGLKSDRIDMLKEIYDHRGERLINSGLKLTENEFIELGIR